MTIVEEYSKEIDKLRGSYDDSRYSDYESQWRLDKHRIFDKDYRPVKMCKQLHLSENQKNKFH